MFNSKPNVVLLLKRNALVCYGGKTNGEQLDLVTKMVSNLEVIDAKSLTDAVAAFADRQQLRKKTVLLLLAESVVFSKTWPVDPATDVAKLKENFELILPFDTPNQRVLDLKLKDHLVLIGTNGQLYNTVLAGLTAAGCRVGAVVPMNIYGKSSDLITPVEIEHILGSQRLTDGANFLSLETRK